MTRRAFEELLVAMVAIRGEGSMSKLDELAVACATSLESLDVAIQLRTDGYPTSGLGASSALARDGVELQIALGEGPTVDASRAAQVMVTDDLAADSRWPLARPALCRLGIAAVRAFPLQVGTSRLGSFTDYRPEPTVAGDEDLRWAVAVADGVTQLLLTFDASDDGDGASIAELEWLASPAGDSPAVVHQATGMVSAQVDCGLEEALVRLRARAFAESTTVAILAREVVARRVRFDP